MVVVKTVVSGFIERWNFLLGAIFVAIVILMPEGLVPGTARLWRLAWRKRARRDVIPGLRGGKAMSALTVTGLCKAFGGLHVTTDVNLNVEPGERRLIIGPNGAGKTTLFNLITGELTPDSGTIHLFGQDITNVPSRRRAHLGMARTYQIITLFARDTIIHNVTLALFGLSPARWNPLIDLKQQGHLVERASAALKRSASRISQTGRWHRRPMASAGASRLRWH